MKKPTTGIIQFNGKSISKVLVEDTWHIAIKPICEAIGVDYKRQHKSCMTHHILHQLSSIQTTTGADGKQYNMVCLPESHIYGWLFAIRTANVEVQAFQRECYAVLYKHFHGKLLARTAELTRLKEQKKLRDKLSNQLLKDSEEYRQLRAAEQELKQTRKLLKEQDAALVNKNNDLFPQL